jgi:hypothetical protein
MPRTFKRMSGTLLASAALAAASLLVPASAVAQSGYISPCETQVMSYCLHNWQQDYESYVECRDAMIAELCAPTDFENPRLVSPTANRND